MKKIRSAITVAALVATSGVVALSSGAGSAWAAGTPTPWAPGGVSQDPNAVGGITFFDASGNVVTSGSTSSAPFSAYAVGLTQLRSTDTKAAMFFYTPQVGQTPDVWTTNQGVGVSTTYPATTAPAPVGSTTLPVRTNPTSDATLDSLAANIPNTSSQAGYQNVYELRIYTNHAGATQGVTYDYADISINSSAHTWQLVWSPDQASTAVTSTLTSNLDTPGHANTGSAITLTDTLNPTAATGTVQFKANGTNIGSPVAVSSGVATVSTTVPADGTNAFTAVFTPTALSGYGASTSNTDSITGDHVVNTTSVSLAESATTGPAFTPVTFTATVTPGTAAGTVKFFDGGAQFGQAAVSGGTATLSYGNFAQGTHAVTAEFFPTDTTNYSNSPASAPVTYTAAAPACTTCTDQQNIQTSVSAGSLSITTPYTSANPLVLPPMVLNASGTQLSTSAPFGTATSSTTPNGTNSIYVVDTRAGDTGWTASASSSDLTGVNSSSNVISGQNVGLTGLSAVTITGNALQSLAFTDNPAANPAVAPGAAGSAGLGGGTQHKFAQTPNFGTASGDGSIGIVGTLTITAPTSTKADQYDGTITFTVA